MPNAAPRPCKHAGCRALTTSGAYCIDHAKVIRKQAEVKRASSSERGYGYRWQQASKGFLKKHPLCQCRDCQPKINEVLVLHGLDHSQENYLFISGIRPDLASKVVDHKIAHDGDQKLFWDSSNWQALTKPCHDRKTATEDGGFRGK